MKRIDHNQVFDNKGKLISEEIVEVIEYPTVEESAKIASRIVAIPLLATADDATVESLAGLFPDWEPAIAVKAAEVYRWDGTLVEVVQAHTTQADWTPDKVPALFKIHRKAGSVAPWKQPIGSSDAYKKGEKVTFEGFTWESLIDGNVWSPTAYPAGWRKL